MATRTAAPGGAKKSSAPRKASAKAVKPGRTVKAAAPVRAAAASKVADPARKPDKPRKPKLVRDSFTIPKTEYAMLAALKDRAAVIGAPSKKSEVLRAGVMALAAMADDAFARAMASVPTLKTGRPSKG